MGMIGEYARVSPSELKRALEDPDWAFAHVQGLRDAEEDAEIAPGEARCLDTHKTWDILRFLLERAEFPVGVIFGEESFAWDADWGMGPPRYLPAARVHTAATALRALSYDQLISGVDPEDLARDDVYPRIWDDPDALEWPRPWYEDLRQYVEAAARDGHALLTWID